MAWLRRGRWRWAIAGVVLVALVAGAIVAWPYVQLYTGAAPPAQFYQKVPPQPALAQDYPRALGVAHNAGNNLGTLATALHYGADVIEVDVISARGQLVAGRDQPLPWLARQLFRGPTLAEAWDRAAAADIVKLDLSPGGPGRREGTATPAPGSSQLAATERKHNAPNESPPPSVKAPSPPPR
jgi:hypothetical protein